MKCQEVERYLQSYIDGEFDPEEVTEIEQHFKFCPVCQKRVAFQGWFKDQFRNRMEHAVVPIRFQREMTGMLKRERIRSMPAAVKLSPAFAVLAVFLVVYFSPHIQVSSPIVEASVDSHTQNLPYDVQSADVRQVKNFFKPRIDYALRIPQFHKTDIMLGGARLTSIRNHSAATLTYWKKGHRYSLVAAPLTEDFEPPENARRIHPDQDYYLVRHNGYNVLIWPMGKIVYSLVSNDDESALLDLVANADYEQ